MRNIILWIVTALVLITVNFLIMQKEAVLEQGITMLFRLAPRDPRSLIQGDYMTLRYALPGFLDVEGLSANGYVVVTLDEKQVATIKRFYRPDQPLEEGEHLVFYRKRSGDVQLGAQAFFFQEGHAEYYENARYGELRVAKSGKSVLVGLRDEDLKPLGKDYRNGG